MCVDLYGRWYYELLLLRTLLMFVNWRKLGQQESIDPLSQPKATAGRDHCFRTCCPSVNSRKTKQQKTMFATGVTMGLAEWIIDDTCLVPVFIGPSKIWHAVVRTYIIDKAVFGTDFLLLICHELNIGIAYATAELFYTLLMEKVCCYLG